MLLGLSVIGFCVGFIAYIFDSSELAISGAIVVVLIYGVYELAPHIRLQRKRRRTANTRRTVAMRTRSNAKIIRYAVRTKMIAP